MHLMKFLRLQNHITTSEVDNPTQRILMATALAIVGYLSLSDGHLVMGALAWWACGINCGKPFLKW